MAGAKEDPRIDALEERLHDLQQRLARTGSVHDQLELEVFTKERGAAFSEWLDKDQIALAEARKLDGAGPARLRNHRLSHGRRDLWLTGTLSNPVVAWYIDEMDESPEELRRLFGDDDVADRLMAERAKYVADNVMGPAIERMRRPRGAIELGGGADGRP